MARTRPAQLTPRDSRGSRGSPRRGTLRLAAIGCAASALAASAAHAYTINGTYQNSGTWNDHLYVATTGKFINLPGGLVDSAGLTNAGIFDNRAGATVDNRTRLMNSVVDGRQVLYNYGAISSFAGATFDNYGLLYNYAGATLDSAAGVTSRNFGWISNAGSFVNAGSYEQTWANVTGAPPRKLINSGTLSNSGSMSIGAKTSLENSGELANSGTFSSVTQTLSNSGAWANSGTFRITGSTASGMSGAAYFSNSGTLTNTGTLTNVDGTVRNYGRLVNDGTISNTSSNYIGEWGRFINYAGSTLFNTGTLSTNHVVDNAGTITNTGTISSSYQLNNLAGGTLASAAGAALKGALYNYGTVSNAGRVESIDNSGVFDNLAGATQTQGMLVNRGTFTNAAGASLGSYLELTNTAGATLVNHGTLNYWHSEWWSSATTNAGTLINDGVIVNNRTFRNTGTLVNEGTLSGNGSFLQMAGSTANTGSFIQTSIDIQGGGFIQRAGSLRADRLDNAAAFAGAGTLQVGRFSNAGSVTPGDSGFAALVVDGSYVQSGNGRLALDIGGVDAGTSYDTLSVTGTAALAGVLDVALGFAPQAGTRFGVLHADGGLSGSFDSLTLPALSGGLAWRVEYAATDVWLQVAATAPVPEPSAGLLFMLGLAGLTAVCRRRDGATVRRGACLAAARVAETARGQLAE
jgi:hypothetical protein